MSSPTVERLATSEHNRSQELTQEAHPLLFMSKVGERFFTLVRKCWEVEARLVNDQAEIRGVIYLPRVGEGGS